MCVVSCVCGCLLGKRRGVFRRVAVFSVKPKSKAALHYAIIKAFDDCQIVCSVHPATQYCEHKGVWSEAYGLSLTGLRANYEAKIRQEKKFRLKVDLISKKRVPVPKYFRYVVFIDKIQINIFCVVKMGYTP